MMDKQCSNCKWSWPPHREDKDWHCFAQPLVYEDGKLIGMVIVKPTDTCEGWMEDTRETYGK